MRCRLHGDREGCDIGLREGGRGVGESRKQVNSEFVKGKPTKHSATHGCRGKLAKVLQSSQLMNIMALVILVDALVTVVDVDARAAGNEPPRAMMVLSDICLCMYTAELLAMIFVGGLRIFLNWMPLLDLLIVLCGYAEMVMANFLTPEEATPVCKKCSGRSRVFGCAGWCDESPARPSFGPHQ